MKLIPSAMIVKIFKSKNCYLFLFILFFLCSCRQNGLKQDVSDIKVEVKIKRFDQDLFSYMNRDLSVKDMKALKAGYPSFFDLYVHQILDINTSSDSLKAIELNHFIHDTDIDSLYLLTAARFKDVHSIEKELENAFKYYKHYFPQKPLPEIVSYISGFNFSIVNADSLIGIGLDMYLGSNCKYYPSLNFPRFKTALMRPEYIGRDCMRSWAESEFLGGNTSQNDLLSEMIRQGKILYFTNAMMPDANDTIITGFSKKQQDFCTQSESRIWAYFIEKKLLFSTRQHDFLQYVSEGPGTKGFPKDAPGNIGSFIGLQIVKAYMKNNSDVNLLMLMNENDASKILNKSKYKPTS